MIVGLKQELLKIIVLVSKGQKVGQRLAMQSVCQFVVVFVASGDFVNLTSDFLLIVQCLSKAVKGKAQRRLVRALL